MKNHLEIEYKTLLSQADYGKLLPEFSHVTPISQTNYYIDTPNFDLKRHRFSLRIRILKDQAELTLKIPQKVGNQEYNQKLSLEQAKELIKSPFLPTGDITSLLKESNLALEKLLVWGSLHTKRYEKETPIGLMALDENTYGNVKDYELEIEVTDSQKGKVAFENFLKERQIPFIYASSKVARTASALKTSKISEF